MTRIPIVFLVLSLGQDKAHIPVDAEIKKAETTLKATFGAEFAAKDRASRRSTGRKFLGQALGASDPVERYVLLRMSLEMAAASLDLGTAIRASDELGNRYDMAPFAGMTIAVTLAKKAVAVPEDAATAADLCLSAWERAMVQGELDLATKWASDALDLAKKSSDAGLKAAVDDIIRDTGEAKRLLERAGKAGEGGVDQGVFLVAVKGDWTKGMALLGSAEDPLGSIARKDAANPTDPETKFEIGEGWAAVAAKEKSPILKRFWDQRSRQWQEDALRTSTGLARTRIAKKLLKGFSIVKATSGKVDVTTLVAEAFEKDPWTPIRTDVTAAGGTLAIEYMINGRKLTAVAKDGEVLIMPEILEKGSYYPGASRPFRVVAAHFGIANTFVDITDKVQRGMQDPFQVFSNAFAASDPFPGRPKHAVLQYEWHGRRFVRMVRDGEGIVPVTGDRSKT